MRRRAFALALLATVARAEEHPELNFAIEWPVGEGWEAPQDGADRRGKLSRVARNPALGRAVLVSVTEPRKATFDGDGYARGLVRGISTNVPGARLVSQRDHEVGGAPALTVRVEAKGDDLTVRIHHLAVSANGHLYTVSATWSDDDESWGEAAVAGFRFLSPPPEGDAAWRLGHAIGQYVLGPALLAALVAGIVFLARRLVRRRSA